MTAPVITQLSSAEELYECVGLLRAAFGTVAREYGLTEQSAPTNAAFSTIENMTRNLQNGMTIYGMFSDASLIGCVATKKAKGSDIVYYIERLAVAPEKRHRGYGGQLLSFALESIQRSGGTTASIGLIDNNEELKKWYRSKGFRQHDCRRIEHLPFKVCFLSMDVRQLENGWECRHKRED